MVAWESLLSVCLCTCAYTLSPDTESLLPPCSTPTSSVTAIQVTTRLLATADAIAVSTENESYLVQYKQVVVSADYTAALLRWPDGRRTPSAWTPAASTSKPSIGVTECRLVKR